MFKVRSRGKITSYQPSSGVGFISSADGGEVLFHHSAVEGGPESPREGQLVEFQIGEDPQGKRAKNVRIMI